MRLSIPVRSLQDAPSKDDDQASTGGDGKATRRSRSSSSSSLPKTRSRYSPIVMVLGCAIFVLSQLLVRFTKLDSMYEVLADVVKLQHELDRSPLAVTLMGDVLQHQDVNGSSATSSLHNETGKGRRMDVEDDDDDTARPPPQPLYNSSCKMMITKKLRDVHYEVLESVALRFQLPWETNERCQNAGLTKDDPIRVDYMLGWHYMGYKNLEQTEGWGWKEYFIEQLQGRVVQRKLTNSQGVQQRWIQYGTQVDETMESFQSTFWQDYAFHVEVNCDFYGQAQYGKYMREDKHYCVLHGGDHAKVLESQRSKLCRLNPKYEPDCWFIPSDLPKVSPSSPPRPFVHDAATNTNTTTLNLCMAWKYWKPQGEYRNPALLVHALQTLRPDHVRVLVIGREAMVPEKFRGSGVEHYVTTIEETDFIGYQKVMAQCHVLVTLMHPDESHCKGYFEGRLSGPMSQAIGRRIPVMMHNEAAAIYRDYLTAPNFEYNSTNATSGAGSFLEAFSRMLKYYQYPSHHVEGAKIPDLP